MNTDDAQAWHAALRVPDEALDLALLSALIAKGEYPHLDTQQVLASFEALCGPVRARGATLDSLCEGLFEALDFKGNEDDYYDPRNSYITDVIERRTGIPITLSVLMIEVGRRCGIALAPVSFPGHFLVCAGEGQTARFVDAFRGGAVQSRETLLARLKQMNHGRALPAGIEDAVFVPCPRREVVARMLRNLKQIYVHKRDWERALRITDQLVHVTPDAAEQYRDRGQIYARIGHLSAARADLSRFMQMTADAGERERVRKVLTAIAASERPLN